MNTGLKLITIPSKRIKVIFYSRKNRVRQNSYNFDKRKGNKPRYVIKIPFEYIKHLLTIFSYVKYTLVLNKIQ